MSKHKILAGSTAPWLRTALTRVQDRIADTVREQITNINDEFDRAELVVLLPFALSREAGITRGDAIHGLRVYITNHVGGPVVASRYVVEATQLHDPLMID